MYRARIEIAPQTRVIRCLRTRFGDSFDEAETGERLRLSTDHRVRAATLRERFRSLRILELLERLRAGHELYDEEGWAFTHDASEALEELEDVLGADRIEGAPIREAREFLDPILRYRDAAGRRCSREHGMTATAWDWPIEGDLGELARRLVADSTEPVVVFDLEELLGEVVAGLHQG